MSDARMALAIALALGAGAAVPRQSRSTLSAAGRSDAGQHLPAGAVQLMHPYLGVWVSADGGLRQQLRADGRYITIAAGSGRRQHGRYRITRTQIQYRDESGCQHVGRFVGNDELHIGMLILRRTLVEHGVQAAGASAVMKR
ncbi:Atu4866 domain-containing protein [Xanthomonas maliensis]|uniref:Atu4866 domain-containing protein n=1 Tax=Xanthomonas maliensis TaxID=1321368 RepID=UPI00039B2E6C|nr:Atu4866 domain-containing protein [Xanthomonas maliensis]KAB7768614.1 hypothetical protein CKY51_09235 [Xanthomonas maliensis]